MWRMSSAVLVLLLLAVMTPAADICNGLTATGVGSFAPKYPKSGAQGTCDNGVYTMLAYGHDYYWAWDRGGFAYAVVRGSGDFSFSARLVDANMADVKSEKVGICVREGLLGNERAVQLRWDGFYMGSEANAQISWLYRFMPGTAASEFCSDANRSSCFQEGGTGVTEANGATLKISRVSGKYKLFVNDAPVADDKTMALGGDSVLVGLIGSFGGGDNPATRMVKFDNINCTGCGSSTVTRRYTSAGNHSDWRLAVDGRSFTLTAPVEQLRAVSSVSLYSASGRLLAARSTGSARAGELRIGSVEGTVGGLVIATVVLDNGVTRIVRCNTVR